MAESCHRAEPQELLDRAAAAREVATFAALTLIRVGGDADVAALDASIERSFAIERTTTRTNVYTPKTFVRVCFGCKHPSSEWSEHDDRIENVHAEGTGREDRRRSEGSARAPSRDVHAPARSQEHDLDHPRERCERVRNVLREAARCSPRERRRGDAERIAYVVRSANVPTIVRAEDLNDRARSGGFSFVRERDNVVIHDNNPPPPPPPMCPFDIGRAFV